MPIVPLSGPSSAEPLNVGKVRFFLNFRGLVSNRKPPTDSVDVEIAEPWGWDGAIFEILQDNGRHGRDIFFSKKDFGFRKDVDINGLTHKLDAILYRYNGVGFESDIQFIMTIDDVRYVLGELDFENSTTDGYSYFNCKVIQIAEEVEIKRRMETSVDVFSDVDVDDQAIQPVSTSLLLLQALNEERESEWGIINSGTSITNEFNTGVRVYNPAQIILRDEIKFTTSPTLTFESIDPDIMAWVPIIEPSENTLTNFNIEVTGVTGTFRLTSPASNDNVFLTLLAVIGTPVGIDNAQQYIMYQEQITDSTGLVTFNNEDFHLSGLTVPRGESVFFGWKILMQAASTSATYTFALQSMHVNAKAISTAISSVVTAVRFIDAFRQVVKSISGMTVIAPRFDVGGEYYDQWITNGKLLRQLDDEPFNITLDVLLRQLNEVDGDYQVVDSSTIFLGYYADFYTDVDMIGNSLIMRPDISYVQTFSDRYTVNKIKLQFKKYEEDENEPGSRFGIHSEIDMQLPNKKVENTKQILAEFIRDGFLIEKIRKDAIRVKTDTATIDDESVVIVDAIRKTTHFEEYMILEQTPDTSSNNFISLLNDGSFNWELMGLTLNQSVSMTGTNAGAWGVVEITPRILTVWDPSIGPGYIEVKETVLFGYNVTSTDLTQRLGEGFLDVGKQFYTNGKFSNKRILLKGYGQYMKACSMYRPDEFMLVQRYLHNRHWISKLEGETYAIYESFKELPETLPDPLVTPYDITVEVIVEFSVYWDLLWQMRVVRGYVNIETHNGDIVPVFINALEYNWGDNRMTITGLKKFD